MATGDGNGSTELLLLWFPFSSPPSSGYVPDQSHFFFPLPFQSDFSPSLCTLFWLVCPPAFLSWPLGGGRCCLTAKAATVQHLVHQLLCPGCGLLGIARGLKFGWTQSAEIASPKCNHCCVGAGRIVERIARKMEGDEIPTGLVIQGIMKMGKLGNLAFKKYTRPCISATSSDIDQECLFGTG